MLQCIFCVKSNPPQYEGPEVLLFINFVMCKIVKEAPEYLKEFVTATFLIQGYRDQFDEFKAISLIGPQDRNGQVEALNC